MKKKKNEKSRYDLEINKKDYKIVGHNFPDGYAIAIRQPIDFELLEKEYPGVELPKDIQEDSIAVDWRYMELEDGSLEQGVQLTIRTLNGTGKSEIERFEPQSIQYIMDMEKFEDLFNAMKKIKKKTPNLEVYRKDKKDREQKMAEYQDRMAKALKTPSVQKEVAERITDTLMGENETGKSNEN